MFSITLYRINMKLFKKLFIFVLVSILLPFSKGYAEKRSGINLEILGQPISAIKQTYSCAPTMISGPSKRKIICASVSERLIVATVQNRVVSVQVIQFTTETLLNNALSGYPESCRKGMESNFMLELDCGGQKVIILELDIIASEIKTEFCFLQHCGSRVNYILRDLPN